MSRTFKIYVLVKKLCYSGGNLQCSACHRAYATREVSARGPETTAKYLLLGFLCDNCGVEVINSEDFLPLLEDSENLRRALEI